MKQERPSVVTAARSVPGAAADPDPGLEEQVRKRLRSLRHEREWSLDELAERSGINASTISRIETGRRRLALDQLAPLARALHTTIDELLASSVEEDVVIRPRKDVIHGHTVWMLNHHPDPDTTVIKMRIPRNAKLGELQVHPGHDWFYVLEGTLRLALGDREILVEAGQAAEFSTMTPHALTSFGGPVELLMIFDRQGERSHLGSPR